MEPIAGMLGLSLRGDSKLPGWSCRQCERDAVIAATQSAHNRFDKQRLAEDQARKQAELDARLGAAGIPARFREYSFDTFPADLPNAVKRRDTLRSYALNWARVKKQGISVAITGNVGTGKTGLACSVANTIMREFGATTAFMTAYGAVRHMRDTWGRKGKTEREALDDLINVDLLVLDEVGASVGTEAEMTSLFEVINGRYSERRPIMLLSNLPLEDYSAAGQIRPGLKTFLGPRVISRFRDDQSFILSLDWPSLRGSDRADRTPAV